MLRVVLDTDVLVAALRSDRGASRQLLLAALDRRVVMLASVPLMVEYEAVLSRPDHLTESGLSRKDLEVLLDTLAAVVEPVRLHFLWRPALRDASDEMVLETALNGHADALVTFDLRDFGSGATEFGLRVVAPGKFWREISGRTHEK